jgi:hypothetical protein
LSATGGRLRILTEKFRRQLGLGSLTALALLVSGYHPFAEDAEIYLPEVEKILNPKLFPVGQEFFLSHARMTLFPNLLALFLRITHLPMEVGLLLWQVASIYLLLLACWQLAGLFFPSQRARWGGVCLVAALLTIPVAGTALYVMDQYLNPRNLAAFAGVFAVTRLLEKKYVRALLWLGFAASMHPLMWVFPASFCLLFVVMERSEIWRTKSRMGAPTLMGGIVAITLAPSASDAYRQAAIRHGYLYIQNWRWYELLGIVAPLFLLWCFGRVAGVRKWKNLERISRALMAYELIYLGMALVFDLPSFETLARIQPLRSLHFLYIILFVVLGGFLGEYVLRGRVCRWLSLFVPLSAGMFLAQRSLFASEAHLELPGMAPRNPWAQAFVWIRGYTPADAVFALDPEYPKIHGEDRIGFRCMAERSSLADAVKDGGVVSMFPSLAEEWWAQVKDQEPWRNLQRQDFLRLQEKYGIRWVILQEPAAAGLGFDCPYGNDSVEVCRLP